MISKEVKDDDANDEGGSGFKRKRDKEDNLSSSIAGENDEDDLILCAASLEEVLALTM